MNLLQYVTHVTGKDKTYFGTAFAIHQDAAHTYLVTCTHVIDDVGGEEGLCAGYKPAIVVESDHSNGYDLAILRVEGRLDTPILHPRYTTITHTSVERTSRFCRAAGYRSEGEKRLSGVLNGNLGDHHNLESTRYKGAVDAWYFDLEEGNLLEHGYSGAPVIDEDGFVLAVIATRHGKGERGLAISITALAKVWSGMPTTLRPVVNISHRRSVPNGNTTDFLMDRDEELAIFKQIAAGHNQDTHLIVIEGESGTGKTELLKQYQIIADNYYFNVLHMPLGSQLTILECLENLIFQYGSQHFPKYDQRHSAVRPEDLTLAKEKEWLRSLTRCFFEDLANYRDASRLAIFFDKFENTAPTVRQWLEQTFIPAIFRHPILVVIAGQETISHNYTWRGCRRFYLKGVTIDWYYRYLEFYSIKMDNSIVQAFHQSSNGKSLDGFCNYARILARSGIQ